MFAVENTYRSLMMPTSGVGRIKELLKQGNELLLEGQYQKGLETFQEIIGLEPQNFEAWCTLGFAHSWLDQTQSGIDSYTQALQIQPDYILALARRGVTYQSIGKAELAMFDLERAISVEPQNAEDWYGRSIALRELKTGHEVLEALEKTININPENPRFWQFRGSILSELKRDEEAIAAYDRALELYPRFLYCWYLRGIALHNIQDYEKAITNFDKALEIEPDNSYLGNWHWRGFALAKLSRYEEAIGSYDRALKINSSNPDVWLNRAYALQNLARYEEAISSFDKVLETSLDHYYAWLNRAHSLRALKQYEAAINSYDSAIKISNDNYFGWAGLGDTLFNSKRYDEAIASYDQALQIQPDNYAAWLWRGYAFMNLKEFDQALVSFERAIEINSNDYHSLVNRAYCLQNLSRYEEAISAFNKVIEIQPDNYAAWLWRGCALSNLKEFDCALVSFEKAIEINSNDYYGLANRTYCLQNLSRYEEAISALNKVIEIKPNDSSAWGIRGYFLVGLSKIDDALDSYNNALTLNCENHKFWHKKASILKLTNRLEQAIDSYRKAQELDPNYFKGWHEYADTFCLLKRYEEALNILNILLERKSDYAIAWSFRSFILIILKRHEEACISSDRALKLDANNFLIWVERALVMRDANHYDEALRSYEQALKFYADISDVSWRSLYFTKPQILTNQGNLLMVLERFEEAISSYQKALAINPATLSTKPDYLQIWNRCGEAFTKLRRYQEALAAYDRSLELDGNQLSVWLERGKIAIFLSQDEKALNSFDHALSIEPENIEALNGRANSLDNLGRYEEAFETFNYLLSLNLSSEGNFSFSFLRANILAKLDRYKEALDILYQILEGELANKCAWLIWLLISKTLTKDCDQSNEKYCHEQIIDACNKALSFLPNENEVNIQPFNYLYIDYFGRRIISLDPEFYALFQALVWTHHGFSLYALANYEEAVESFENALNFDTKNSWAWREKGNALFELKRYEQTRNAYDTYLALTQNENDWLILMQRGVVLRILNRYTEAVSSYRKAIQIEPKQHRLWHELGVALNAIGQIEEALNAYQQSLKLDSQCVMAWAQQGHILANLYRYQESLESFDRAIALDSESAEFHNGRGWALTGLGFYTEALAAYNQALQNDQQFWQAWRNRGWTIYISRSLDEALEVWDEGLRKLKPEYPNYAMACAEVHYFKGLAHYEQGRKQADCLSHWRKARNYYQIVLKLLDSPDYRERYLDILKDLVKILVGLGQNDQANELGRKGTELLQRLLSETVDPLKQQQLALKYASFEQLTVDSYVQSGQLVKALETAETGKNTCLSWLLLAHSSEANSLEQQQVWQLLNPSTAIVYWHLSSANLTTFILTYDSQIPAILPKDDVETPEEEREELPQSYRQLLEFEKWVNKWNLLYADYGNALDKRARENHSWRTQMPEKLEQLKQILRIPKIIAQLPSNVSQIILIPHRDLHRFPLHALFPDRFTLTYLPSIQMGLNLKGQKLAEGKLATKSISSLLSVEAPNSIGEKQHKKFERLGFAALESRLIAQMFQTTTIESHEANQQKVRVTLQQPHNGFHFTGHAAYNFYDPKTSALALTGEERLTVVDICGEIPLVQDYSLVCLSACETALTGNQTITAEYVGLVSGFLRGGANKVVSTLWTVQSVSSTLLMIQFYSLLKNGTPAATALGEAQRWLRDANCQILIEFLDTLLATYISLNRNTRAFLRTEINRFSKMPHDKQPFEHPYHWAGFTLTGLLPQL